MSYSSLYDLIESIEHGTKLHIGVIFFGFNRCEQMMLPRSATIHTGEYCWKIKEYYPDERKCCLCRNLAIRKALYTGKPFSGLCIHGVWEYTHPILKDGNLIGIIFIGNILEPGGGRKKLLGCLERRGLSDEAERLMGSMEQGVDIKRCEVYAGLIESYVLLLLSAGSDAGNLPKHNSVIEDMLNFIEDNLCDDISIRTISELFHYNGKYIGRLFKNELNCSISMYICRRRIERAMLLLRDTGRSITDIATGCGFDNVPYFNRRFRQITGMQPSEYRKACRDGKPLPQPLTPMISLDQLSRKNTSR